MSVYETIPRPLPLGTLTAHRAISAIERLLESLHSSRRARATEMALHGLSDKQLSDIGLHRGAIPEVALHLSTR